MLIYNDIYVVPAAAIPRRYRGVEEALLEIFELATGKG